MKHDYEVIVGNIGSVFVGTDAFAATATYREYMTQSRNGYSRAAGEPVTLMRDGEVYKEYVPAQSDDADQ